MNLIEQLGGYDKAKEWYKDQDLRGNHTYRIRAALLEYRRANNIFEVGDNVVFDNKHSKDSKVFKVDSDISGKKGIRHATDAEIAAGHRLPTCEVSEDGKQK